MRITVITVNYNDAEGLKKTIRSVIGQGFDDMEHIVVDGGSSDGSVDVIKRYEKHISAWVSERDKGIYNAMNKGVGMAHGDYVNFMNSGDVYYSSDVLNTVVPQLTAEIVCGRHVMEGENYIKGGYANSDVTMTDLFTDALNHQSCFISRALLEAHPYREDYRIVSDWIFTIETVIKQNVSLRLIDTVIALYDNRGISNTQEKLRDSERRRYLESILPPRMITDYDSYIRIKKTAVYPYLSRIPAMRYGMQKLLAGIIKCFTSIFCRL